MIVRRSFTCVVLLVAVLWAMAIAADPAMEWLLFAVTCAVMVTPQGAGVTVGNNNA